MLYDFDLIVVGGGAGGSTLAYACAQAGKSVLILERGDRHTSLGPSFDEQAVLINKGPYDDREVELNGIPKRLYMGGILGGRHQPLWCGSDPPERAGLPAGTILWQANPEGDLGLAHLVRRP